MKQSAKSTHPKMHKSIPCRPFHILVFSFQCALSYICGSGCAKKHSSRRYINVVVSWSHPNPCPVCCASRPTTSSLVNLFHHSTASEVEPLRKKPATELKMLLLLLRVCSLPSIAFRLLRSTAAFTIPDGDISPTFL